MPQLWPALEPLIELPRTSAVIPTLDEGETIAHAIAEIPRDLVAEIIVADGGSRDATLARAEAAGARSLAVGGRGYGRACTMGAAAADPRSTVIVFLDGDGADRGDLIGRLIMPIAAGTHDLVLASRTRGKREPGAMLWHQVLAGRVIGSIIRFRYGVAYTDMCAFRAIRRDVLENLGMREMTYGWNVEMQVRAAARGLRILEVPMPYRRRKAGNSKVAGSLSGTLRASFRILGTIVRLALRRLD